MVPKPKKTTAELTEELIMGEIRKNPECDHIIGVGFTRPMRELGSRMAETTSTGSRHH